MHETSDMTARLKGDWLFPTRIRFGAGRLAELAEVCGGFGIARPLVVTDRVLATTALAARVLEAAKDELAPRVFAGVQENPTDVNVAAGVADFRDGQCDGVIALGGGSALDCGKTIALLAGCGGPLWRFAWPDHEAAQDERGAYPIVAIPTTAGTGAEVEPSAIITDSGIPAKRAILHPAMMPRAVIADPELTVSLPARLTAATGMDALSHCLEALCVSSFHPMADAIAASGIAMAAKWLPVAVAEPANLEARAGMMAAAIMGATAFGKGLGAMHALSHAIGALHGHHHGLTNAVLMPYVLTFNRPAIEPAMVLIAGTLRLPGEPFSAVRAWIVDLRRRIGIPETLTGLGVAGADFRSIATLAASDICAGMNPVPVDASALEGILQSAA
jgi:alcohol dehydrogenase